MSFKKTDFDKVAHLAALEFTETEAQKNLEPLSQILSYFDQIKSINTDSVAPMVTPHEIFSPLREDVISAGLARDEILESAPEVKDSLYKVPPVV